MLELRILADRDALGVWPATSLAEQEHATVDDTPMTILIPEGQRGPGHACGLLGSRQQAEVRARRVGRWSSATF